MSSIKQDSDEASGSNTVDAGHNSQENSVPKNECTVEPNEPLPGPSRAICKGTWCDVAITIPCRNENYVPKAENSSLVRDTDNASINAHSSDEESFENLSNVDYDETTSLNGVGIPSDNDDRSQDEDDADERLDEVLTLDQVFRCLEDSVAQTKNLINYPVKNLRMLLSCTKWDINVLCDTMFSDDKTKRDELLKLAFIRTDENNSRAEPISKVKGDTEECPVCYTERPSSVMHGLECIHRFCNSCWSTYLANKIVDEGKAMFLCQGFDCCTLVDDATVMKYATEEVYSKYQNLLTSFFIQNNRNFKWCPFPGCSKVIKVHDRHVNKSVICECGHAFCFQCLKEPHDPIVCQMLKNWLIKCSDDAETIKWMEVHTKECPQCKANIEKDGGCNLIICRNLSCGLMFCWVCMQAWNYDQLHSCDEFLERVSLKKKALEVSQIALERYTHYYYRYFHHKSSLQFESDLFAMVDETINKFAGEISWIELQFLKQAVETLCRCRRTLMYTYVFAFYEENTKMNNQIQMFEQNQQVLHDGTERLSLYLENEVENATEIMEVKKQLQQMFTSCERQRKTLIEHILEGRRKGWWTLNE